ncbi:hypothetical protein HT031_004887 [Scenedesmus sp. PABB004]|nr:hypothetical protein HT031_004887 [Scenedesmus sp. PABB004]
MQLKDPFAAHQARAAAGPAVAGGAAADGDAQPAQLTDDGDGAAAPHEEAEPRPDEVIKAFAAAKGELEWLQATLVTLAEGKYLTVGRVEKVTGPQRLADLAIAANARFRRRAASAAAAAAALSEGAAALAALGAKEDAFYGQVASLQRYWKVSREPADSAYAYAANLRLAAAPPEGPDDDAAAIGRGPVGVVRILKDPSGGLRVQVPPRRAEGPPSVMAKAAEEPPVVFAGPAAIHGLLLQQLRLNAWHCVLGALDAEIGHMLGLPARLQPSAAARAATSAGHLSRAGSGATQQGSEAAGPWDGGGGSGGGAPAAAARAGGSTLVRQVAAMGGGAHFTFYATLSSLVLQAVVGSAATAGEAEVLEQQQATAAAGQPAAAPAPAAAAREPSADPGARGGTPACSLSMDGSLGELGELDVGAPWERAAAEAAAAAGAPGLLPQQQQQPCGGGAAPAPAVVTDPQLLSLRPLALEHLIITQLGHLLTSPRQGPHEGPAMAASAYAAARERERAPGRGGGAGGGSSFSVTSGAGGAGGAGAAAARARGAAGGGGGGGGVAAPLLLPAALSLLTALSRWLSHSSSRELLRRVLDEALLPHPGAMARTLASCHMCVAALQLGASPAPAARERRAPEPPGPPGDACGGRGAAADAAPLVVLLTDTSVGLEGAGLGVSSGARGLLGAHSRARDVQQGVTYLHALPGLLAPALRELAAAAAAGAAL